MHKIKQFLAAFILTSLFVFSVLPFGASAAEQTPFTLRVGYWENYGIMLDQNGQPYGYTCDYFNEIAKINGWKVEYIPCDWSNGLEMLARGDIDIFGPMQKTPAREKLYDYPLYPMGFEYGALYIDENNQDIYYNNLESMNGKTVGVVAGDYFALLLQQFCNKNDMRFQYKTISSQNITSSLHDGTIDILVTGSMLMPTGTKIALKFAPQEFYYSTTKGNTLVLNGMNDALEQIRRKNIYFDAELHNKYYVSASLNNEALTKAEKEYIENAPVIRVGYFGEHRPFEYYEDKTQSLIGITPDILQMISDYSGLRFELVPLESEAQCEQLLRDGSIQMLSAITGGKNLESLLPVAATDTALKTELNFIVKQGEVFDQNPLVLALPKNWVSVLNHMRYYYPVDELKLYDTPAQCLDAVLHGDANLTVQNTFMAETSLKPYKYRQLTVNSMRWGEAGLRFGVAQHEPLLLSIMNKSIASINVQRTNEIVYQHTIRLPYSLTFADRLRYNAPLFILLIWGFLAVLCLFTFRYQRILNKLAFSDALTGEMNLNRFKLKTKELLSRASESASFALLSLDIDKFKSINNLYGYAYGDSLIRSLARALHDVLPENAMLCRDTADRFYLFFSYPGEEHFSNWFDTMVLHVNREIAQDMPECRVVLSGGICLAQPRADVTALLDQANLARLKVKSFHQSSFAFYQQAMYDQVNSIRSLENDMSAALSNEEFVVYLQPKIALTNGKVAGAEALVRWQRPGKGLVPPDQFIPLFEQNGFVVNLDFYVLEQVCKLLERWKHEGHPLFPISVNFSRRHLFRSDTVSCLTNIISRYDVSPTLIELELTESAFDNCNIPSINELFELLHQQGLSVSVDDFGVGYSSLALLKDLPIDALKIDKSFFNRPQNVKEGVDRSEILLASVIRLSEQLNIRTISEGVETEQQVRLLQKLGCNLVQGFYFAKPMPIVELEELIESSALTV